jgi:site-specific recombinase XerD
LAPSSGGDRIDAFINDQRQKRWQSEATHRSGRWKVVGFMSYLDEQGYELGSIDATDVDAYFQHIAQRLSRYFAAHRGHGPASVVAILRSKRLDKARLGRGDTPATHLRRLQLDDVDWQRDRLHVVRSKSLRPEVPLESSVGNAIARYLRHGRPKGHSRSLFLTWRAPYRTLSGGALRNVVRRYLSKVGLPARGCGPHGLRHACARHLLEAGHSFKETGDHLGHRSPESTKIYVTVNLAALRLVQFETLGGVS